ncbi:MAG: GrpB family protein [Burkholderiaceae bacterium]|nr:GrpB family protein [Burkholderiaceae bacterium]
MAEQPIQIAEYDLAWPSRFQDESAVLAKHLRGVLVGRPEHIGSTAVPGLAAKPIIDIMAPVRSLEQSRAAIAMAGELGYMYYPYKAEVMHWFCKPSPERRTHHLHLVPQGSRLWQERIAFRNALRGSSELRKSYQELKQDLARQHGADRDGYTEAKGEFIRTVLRQVLGPESSAA